ncbi:MAG: hypothetical protein ACJARK_002386, partial [Marinobacter psychrophilus]
MKAPRACGAHILQLEQDMPDDYFCVYRLPRCGQTSAS